MIRIFLAGIIQGSITGAIHPQDYRSRIKDVLAKHVPDADVYCPLEHHRDSLAYDDARGRDVFFGHVERVRASDVLVAFLPEASMGTAVEMWEAHRKGLIVISVTPMRDNWTVKFLSTRIFADLDEFEHFVATGELTRLIATRKGRHG